ncbi:multicopper oxidase domain-containing protein, partial [Modestobacter sp. NPDC049651]
WPVQVLSVGNQVVDGVQWRDVVNVPALGQTVVRVAFADVGGRTVYHCHILDHEDQGMMAVIEARS